ncbi:signal transduction histidine kinase [Phenylobacterium koreense]|uniref:Signal transduction histidine kinase n=1 Tax=Phenylobacterium koreense TaxID=266125 RepID=A0ABV2EME6_9CAUL
MGVIDGLPLPFALVDPAQSGLKFLSATEPFLATLGLPRTAVEGRDLAQVFLAEAFPRVSDAVMRCAATCQTVRVRAERQTPKRDVYDVVAHPLADLGAGDLVALIIEAPLRQPSLMAQRQALLDYISPLSPSMYYIYDLPSSRTQYMHRDLAAMLGFAAESMELAQILARVHPEDQPILNDHVAAMSSLSDGQTTDAVVRVHAPGSEYRWVRSRCRILRRARDGAVRLVVGAASDVTEQYRQAEELDRASRALALAEIEERRRVGRELHDSTAQHLLAVDLSLAAMERRNAFDSADMATLRELRSALSAARKEIRTLSYVLHPPNLEGRGLPAAIKAFADGFARRTSLDITVEADPTLRLPEEIEHALFRIFQEALMNVHRHTAATCVCCAMSWRDGVVRLDVEDNGRQPGELPFNPAQETGVGIAGMRARLKQFGGRLILERGASGLLLRAEAPFLGEP